MSRSVREWLPAEAAESGALRRLVNETVAGWGPKWFVRTEAAAASFEACRGAAPRHPGCWQAYGTVAISQVSLKLGGHALGADPDLQVLSETDRDVIGRFTAAIASDLAGALEAALGLDPAEAAPRAAAEDPFAGDGGLLFDVNERGGRPLLHVAVPAAALVPFLKGAMPAPRRRPATFARLGRAFESTSVRIEARLGAATLPLGALAGLAPGDVVILDRGVEDGAELALGRSGRSFATGSIVAGERDYSLLLHPPQQRD